MSDFSIAGPIEGIAVIGMAGRFPGASNLAQFWRNLCDGVESVQFFTGAELRDSGVPANLLSNPDYVRAGTLLPNADRFDAAFFGFTPREAEILDPQQRVFLECAWESLENAGYDAERFAGAVGVFAGAGMNHYLLQNLLGRPDVLATVGEYQTMLLSDKDFLTTRAAYKLNLRGPAVTVQTACSTSLVAIHQAVQSLLNYGCDMALAGGVSVNPQQGRGYLYQTGMILAQDGHCRAFDADAQGTVGGAGCGIVVLKRLADALADGDRIDAVIRGTATNNDGSQKVGYTAPSVSGQAEVVALAQAVADVSPDSISYIEAHGTGTPLGDPIEIAALTQAFRRGTQRKQFCAIGSLKPNIGHPDAAAGVAGLIKAALALKHQLIPPSINFAAPNPKIDFVNSPFFVNTELRDWVSESPRRAGVSSFGIGGTNAHAILEEAPPEIAPPETKRTAHLLALSAKTETALDAATDNLADFLRLNPNVNLADAAYTLQIGRKPFAYRRVVAVREAETAVSALESRDAKRVFSARTSANAPPVVFMFPGQGAQAVGMGRACYENEPVFREIIERGTKILCAPLDFDLRDILYPAPQRQEMAEEKLAQTAITQPALFLIEYAFAQLWQSWGVRPSALVGHSVGEYVAACLAGVFTFEDGLRLLAKRGELMQIQPAGAMLAVRRSAAEIAPLLINNIEIAAENSPSLCVVSGPNDAMQAFQQILTERKIVSKQLPTSHAFHSEMMAPALAPFLKALHQIKLSPPQIPFVSNVTGDWITNAQAIDPNYWAAHLRQTVRFAPGLETIFADPNRVLLEVGPGQTLTTLARQCAVGERTILSASASALQAEQDDIALQTAVGRLWLAGVSVDWDAVHVPEPRRRIALPTYPFERKRFWIEAPRVAENNAPDAAYYNEIENKTESTEMFGACNAPARTFRNPVVLIENAMQETVAAIALSSRAAELLSSVVVVIEHLTGIAPPEIDPTATFLELGFDSLLLVQLSQSLQTEFRVKVAIVQLLEEIDTPQALVNYLDEVLPKPAAPMPIANAAPLLSPAKNGTNGNGKPHVSPPPPTPCPIADALPIPASGGGELYAMPSTAIEQLMTAQLQVMSNLMTQQLEALRVGSHPPAPSPNSGRGGEGITSESIDAPPSLAGMGSASAIEISRINSPPPLAGVGVGGGGFPFPTMQVQSKNNANELTPIQRQYLDNLTAKYTAKTANSKRQTQQYRAVLADSRAATGFRLLWKELVYPIVGQTSCAAKITDLDDNEYVDVALGFGLHPFGHSPAFLVKALEAQIKESIALGPQSPMAGEAAERICRLTNFDRAIFCNSGTEAIMGAIRAARTFTRRHRIAIFTGAYHGWADSTLARAVGGTSGRSIPLAPGVPQNAADDVLVLDYGKPESLEILKAQMSELAAVLVEPVQSRNPDLQPREFLQDLRRLTEDAGTVLIFDEMITGFRVHTGGAQAVFGVQADLATYGKHIGGGLPIGVVAGRAKFMDVFDGGQWNFGDDSYPQAEKTLFTGAFFKHPLTMAAMLAIFRRLEAEPELLPELNRKTADFAEQANAFFTSKNIPLKVAYFGSLWRFVALSDLPYLSLFYYNLILRGVYYPLETSTCFLSTAHTAADVNFILRAIRESATELQNAGFFPEIEERPPNSPSPPDSGPRLPMTPHSGNGSNGIVRPAPPETNGAERDKSQKTSNNADRTPPVNTGKIAFSLYYFGAYSSEFQADKYRLLLEGAKFADRNDFAAVWLPERHFHAFGGFSPNPSVLAAAIAAQTERVQIRAGSVVLPLHHPIRVAEEWAMVDNLSRGRVGVSFATGWHPNDFVFRPEAYQNRHEILKDGIETVRKLWRGESVPGTSGTGEPLNVRLFPMPLQAELPAWITGVSRESFVRAGALGVGILTNLQDQTIEELAAKIAAYRAALTENGHAAALGHVTVLVHTFLGEDAQSVREQARQPFYNYLRSALSITSGREATNAAQTNGAKTNGAKANIAAVDDSDMDYLLGAAYQKYVDSKAFLGTVETATPIAEKLLAAGVNEVGCLIDFGVDTEAALQSLPYLNELRKRLNISQNTQIDGETETGNTGNSRTKSDGTESGAAVSDGINSFARWRPAESPSETRRTLLNPVSEGDSAAGYRAKEFIPSSPAPLSVPSLSAASLSSASQSMPLTDAQRGLLLLSTLSKEASLAYHESVAMELRGSLNVEALQEALAEIVARHEALRVTFHLDDGVGYQKIAPNSEFGAEFRDVSASENPDRTAQEFLAEWERKPFDLTRQIPVRACLIRLNETVHRLALTFHHVTVDGASVGIILNELQALYSAKICGNSAELLPATPFRQYVAALQAKQNAPEMADAETYWKRQFSEPAAPLELPADRLRSATPAYRGARANRTLDAETCRNIKRAGAQNGDTFFMTLLAAYQVLLRRLSGQEDVTVAIASAGHSLIEGGDSLVGFCLNVLPIRSALSGSPTFAEFLKQTKTQILAAQRHQNYFWGRLLESDALPAKTKRAPLFSTVFNMDRAGSFDSFTGLATEFLPAPCRNPQGTSRFDIAVNAVEIEGRLLIEFDYDSDLFNAETINRWLSHFETLLHGIAANPQQLITELPLLTEAEQHQILVEWNDTASDYPRDSSIASLFEAQANQTPDAIALTFGEQTLTYAELNRRANRIGHTLKNQNFAPGSPVGICVERSPEMIIGLLAILKAGCAYLPLEANYPAERLQYILEETEAPLVLVSPQTQAAIPARVPRLDLRDETQFSSDETNPVCESNGESLAYILYTSGSTGKPKGVLIPQRGVVRLVKNTNYVQLTPNETVMQFAPLSFDASTFEIWGALLNGGTLALCPVANPSLSELGAFIQSEKITTLWLTAALFAQLIEAQIENLRGVRQLLAGGDVLPVSAVKRALETLPNCELINGYGPTENTTFSCCHALRPDFNLSRPAPIGRPIANSQAYILDKNLQPVPIGVPGELYLAGDGLAQGYLNNPTITAERFLNFSPFPAKRIREGGQGVRYATGDLARFWPDGVIEFLGRRDQQIKLRGYRIELGEIEAALHLCPAVADAALTVQGESGDRRLLAYVALKNGQTIEINELRDFLRKKLPDYMIPAQFLILDELPLNANGKIDRRALPALSTAVPVKMERSAEQNADAPLPAPLIQLLTIWERLIGAHPIHPDDNFFDLGGNSLTALRLFAEIKKNFQKDLPLSTLLEAPTAARLAAVLQQETDASMPSRSLVPIQTKGAKPPFFCIHGGGGHVLFYYDMARRLGDDQPFYGLQAQGMDGKSPRHLCLEDMASHYIGEMKTVQPIGPYYLGGVSLGGVIAYEMAQQLQANGEKVSLLALFEGLHPDFPQTRPGVPDWARLLCNLYRTIEHHAGSVWMLERGKKWPYLREKAMKAREEIGEALVVQSKKIRGRVYAGTGKTVPPALEEVQSHSYIAWMNYKPTPYPGAITLFRATNQPLGIVPDPTLGWKDLPAGGVEIHDVPGYHAAIVSEPRVRFLVAKLRPLLEKAQNGTDALSTK